MAKLERITNKIFGETATATGDNPQIGQFGSAKAGTYIGTTDIETLQALPAYSNGWIDAVTPQNQFPALPEMTGVMKVMSYQSSYLHQMGVSEYDANTTYYTNSFCQVAGEVYKSIADNNQGNDPTTKDSEYWVKYDRFLNKNQITNCVLEAPNGIATYQGNNITIKSGLKVLMPNGLNADGTLKNIELELEQDLTRSLDNPLVNQPYILLVGMSKETPSTLRVDYFPAYMYYEQTEQPNLTESEIFTYGLWYNPDTNESKIFQNNVWTDYNATKLGIFKTDGTATISELKNFSATNILKQNDRTVISGWGLPSNKRIYYAVGPSGSSIFAPANGILNFGMLSNIPNLFVRLCNRTTNEIVENANATYNAYPCISIRCNKGDQIDYTYQSYDNNNILQFLYLNGEV